MKMRTLLFVAACLAIAHPAMADEVTIKIENFTFNPETVEVKPGTKVTWVNGDDIPHSVVENKATFHSAALDTGEKFSLTVTEAGEIHYFCGLHPHMTGVVVVKP